MDALAQRWFAAGERESEVSQELEALADRPEPDFTRLKVGLACLLAAFAMLLLPVLKPSPAPLPVPHAALAVPRPVAVTVKPAAKTHVKAKAKSKPRVKRLSGEVLARK